MPNFEQVKGSRLYEMPHLNTDAGWCAYLLGRNDNSPEVPISIQQSFENYSGHYLFALSAPSLSTEDEVQSLIDEVNKYLGKIVLNARVCLWIDNFNFEKNDFPSLIFDSSLSGWNLQSDFNAALGNQVTLSANRKCYISSSEVGLRLYSVGGETSIRFVTTPDQRGPSINPNEMIIPFFGQYSGCFLIAGELKSSTLEFFEVGLRFQHGGSSGTSPARQIYPVISTDNPSAVRYIGSMDPLDPINGCNTTVSIKEGRLRTLFVPMGKDEEQVAFKSWLRTDSGREICLLPQSHVDSLGQPLPNSGAFVFEKTGPMQDKSSAVYLTFAGDFALEVADKSGSVDDQTKYNLLCGLFGSELLTFRPYIDKKPFDLLRFLPRSPAFASVFPFPKASLDDPSTVKPKLDDTYLTSWATVINGNGGKVTYAAQPEGSPLFHASDSKATSSEDPILLEAFAPDVNLPQASGFSFPMVPYSGIGSVKPEDSFRPEDLVDFESQILAPLRKQLIRDALIPHLRSQKELRLKAVGVGPEKPNTTTLQGLLASVVTGPIGADYLKVILAKFETGAGKSAEMAFLNLDAELQNLFQTNQLFAVITNPAHLGKLSADAESEDEGTSIFENGVNIAGWTMNANVGNGVTATSYRNIMIFKFCEGSLSEMVASPLKWTDTGDFSVAGDGDQKIALSGLSQWLQEFIKDSLIEANERNNSLYKNFARIVTDPDWNGILVLRADVNPSGFPDQIKGLTAGIDLTLFEAHHFGISASKVKVDGSDIDIDGSSSLFGLIDYQNPLFRQNMASGGRAEQPLVMPTEGPYGFSVLQLQALFQNSSLIDFQSRVQLTVNELFGSAVKQTYGVLGPTQANAVVLKGSYQRQNDVTTYIMEQDAPVIFTIDSNIFNSIAFSRVQFNTLTAGAGDSASLRGRFLIWGSMNFASLKDANGSPFDVLSFGTPDGTSPQGAGKGLEFSGLELDITSPLSTPNAMSFTFNAGSLAFDLASSTFRPDSLFQTLALQLDSFLAVPEDKRPSDLGFLPVNVGVSLKAISGPWFGVVYKISMGTPGSLAEKVGFESRILLAWSPQSKDSDDSYAALVGIQLPGAAPGAKLISIQGILKISIDKIELLYETVTGGTKKAFNLRLSNIGLRFLGIAKLPPGASINFFLFGDPEGTGSLGWYAAYKKDEKSGEVMVPLEVKNARMLLDGPRGLGSDPA